MRETFIISEPLKIHSFLVMDNSIMYKASLKANGGIITNLQKGRKRK